MWRHPLLKAVLLIYIGWGGWNWYSDRPFHQPDGVLAADDPQQTNLPRGDKVQAGRWTLTVRADYRITARILARERYHFDALADLVPEDLALGWGPMSDNRILRTIDISQSNRFYYWRAHQGSPPKDAIITHSANTHVIPQNKMIARQLSRLRPGQVVTLSGELVDGLRDDGRWIKTSLVRDDTGAGACEVLLVNDIALQP
ncbi:MAG TPA: hypothetical protein VNX69_17725 [Steroidobacteraceae bacterium]|jgi:hypothetical protein|nr:hypothetical protein [Steroidobacteraceae bacterium]